MKKKNMGSSTSVSEISEKVFLVVLFHRLFPLEYVYVCKGKSNFKQKKKFRPRNISRERGLNFYL